MPTLALLGGCRDERSDFVDVQLADELYRFPRQNLDAFHNGRQEDGIKSGIVIDNPSNNRPYIRYESEPVEIDRISQKTSKKAFWLIYRGFYQPSGPLHAKPVMHKLYSEFRELKTLVVVNSSAGEVYCSTSRWQERYHCGLIFQHRNVEWQLWFDWTRRFESKQILAQAIETLEHLRINKEE